MDFADDVTARDVRDEFPFKAFLVVPVYQHKAHDRSSPAGAEWYDARARDCRRQGVEARAAGSHATLCACWIHRPGGAGCRYTSRSRARRSRCSFTGTDGSFDYYEDDGVS
jgi:hypothetical protein